MPSLIVRAGLAAKYAWVRTAIFAFRAIPPLSFVYLGACIVWPPTTGIRTGLAVYAVIEATFYTAVYLPLRHHLQKPAVHPPLASAERRALFNRCAATIPDAEAYLRGWFLYSDPAEIKRGNIREFLVWSFWHAAPDDQVDEEELEEYVCRLEAMLGRQFQPGRGEAKCMRVTVDRVRMQPRPLLWYLIINVVDTIASSRLALHGFTHYRSRRGFSFPPQLISLLTRHVSPAGISYWYRPHKSTSKRPVLYIHGIGIGLFPYVSLLQELAALQPDVGIIAVEIMSISARITAPQPLTEELRSAFTAILDAHGWLSMVVAANSYGTFVTTQIFRSPTIRPRIASMLLIDPVCLLLHQPDVAYNFTFRTPRRRTEWTLWYFAATDMGVAHTLHRRSFWTENIMWREDLDDLRVAVALGSDDVVVNTVEVRQYLGQNVEVLWFPGADHADVFDHRNMRQKLLQVLSNFIEE